MLKNIWLDTRGGIVSMELVLVASLVAAGVLGGMSKFSHNITDEFLKLGDFVSYASETSVGDVNESGIEIRTSGTDYYFLDESMLRDEESTLRNEARD